MTVPEASVYKNGCVPLRQDDIRSSRETPHIDTETKTLGVKRPPKENLRFGIGTTDP